MTTSYGNATNYTWGGFDWGAFDELFGRRAEADMLAIGPAEQEAFADFVSKLLNTDARAYSDTVALRAQEARCNADLFVPRLPTDALSKRVTKPIILVEWRLVGGTVRFAQATLTAAGVAWEGRLLNAGTLERSFGEVVDDARLVIADPLPDGSRFSDRFTTTTPPEATEVIIYILALDDELQSLIELFRGRVEQIVSVQQASFAVEVVRSDAILDRIIGRRLDTAIAPNAPDESLGKMLPMVYGQVEEHEGLVTDFNAITALDGAINATETTVRLRDASRFPSAGSAVIDDEVISWTGKSGEILLNVSRGTAGTAPAEHASNSTVIQAGTFEVTFADHPVEFLSAVRILDPNGNLAVPDPLPTLDAASAKATWPVTPTIEVPSRSIDVIIVGFNGIGATNTAGTAGNMLREAAAGYTDINFTTLTPGVRAEVNRQTPIEQTGEITRAALIVIHDPTAKQGLGVSVGAPLVGALSATDNIPEWAVRRVERQLRATYDVNDPTHNHTTAAQAIIAKPSVSNTRDTIGVNTSAWNNTAAAFDGDLNNPAVMYDFEDLDSQAPSLSLGAIQVSIGQGQTISRARVCVWYGGLATSGHTQSLGAFEVRVTGPGGISFSFIVTDGSALNPTTTPTLECSPWSTNVSSDPNDWANSEILIRPIGTGGTNGLPGPTNTYLIRDIYIELESSPDIQPAATGLTQRRFVMNFFDVTALANGDITWFSDPARSQVAIHYFPPLGPGTARVAAVFWAIEMRPNIRTAIEVPRVFTDIRGIESQGRPTEIIRDVITRAEPRGLGLDPAVPVQGDYATAAASLAGDGVRLDFAVRDLISGRQLISKAAEQADLRQWWDQGRHVVRRKVDPANLGDVFAAYRQKEVRRNSLGRQRSSIEQVVNEVEAAYRFSTRAEGFTRVLTQLDAASQALFGQQREAINLDLVRNDATATVIVARRLARLKDPRHLVTFRIPLFGLSLRRGDLISLTHILFSFSKAEVVAVPLVLDEFALVEVTCIVWEE